MALSLLTEPSPEVERLIETLLNTSERLEHLTAGQIDTVTNRHGQTFVLRAAQEERRNSESTRQAAILNALPAQIALLSADGTIVSVNAAWRRFANRNHLALPNFGIGSNYLGACDAASGSDVPVAQAAAAGIRTVLDGSAPTFALEYLCPSEGIDRWYRMCVTPLDATRLDGVVVLHDDITTETEAAFKQRDSEYRFRQMAKSIRDVFYLRDNASGEILYVSPAYETIWGRSCESLYADPQSWLEAVHPDDLARTKENWALKVARGDYDLDYRIVRPDGSVRWIESRGFPIRNDAGVLVRMAGIVADVSDRKAANDRIAHLNRVHAMLSGISSIMVRASNREELYDGVCRVAVEAGGFRVAWIGIVDQATMSLVPTARAGTELGFMDEMNFSLLPGTLLGSGLTGRALREKQTMVSNDLRLAPSAVLSNAHIVAGRCSLAIVPLIVADEAVGVLALYAAEEDFFHADELKLLGDLARDIAYAIDHNNKRERLDYLSYYDALTGLANRTLFLERVDQHIRTASREGHKLALFVIDLERFKNVNDGMGHLAGDTLLLEVGQWMAREVGDASLVARLGADRFAVILPKMHDGGRVVHLLEKTLQAFAANQFKIQNVAVRIAARSGVAIFPDDGDRADTLFKNAESALKKAKASGDHYLFYTSAMATAIAGSLTLENQLRQAIDRDEFVLHYQPKTNLQTGALTGAEALIRWNDPRTGLVPPGRFIPMLEETGLIHVVGQWAIRQAVEDYARWRAEGRNPVRISVNVSALQLRNTSFLAELKQQVASSPAAAAGLEVEVTESLIMEDARNGNANLQAIRGMGIRIAIDDFGTGYSSLGYLARLPVDSLKIDRSFVTDMTASQEGLLLVSTIITLAHSLKLNVVAEGVETEEQARLLRLLNCDEMQGFLFSRPIPPEDFEERFLPVMPGPANPSPTIGLTRSPFSP